MKKNNPSETILLGRIARYLMLHGSFTDNIGLLNGKTGFALFFYEYSRYTGKKLYKEFANELIKEIYREINEFTSLNFREGLCGIGWAIEYFLRNHHVEGEPDKVLEEFDKKIVEWDVRRITDLSLEKGLCGIACYVVARLQNRENTHPILTGDYCSDLLVSLDKNGKKDKEALELRDVLFRIINRDATETFYNPVYQNVEKTKFDIATLFEKKRPKGIANNGYTGIGLKLILT
ncbi:hypothetical protein FACS1894203_2750 [Bacteroidia bacterium]|nr:hypothetical protein FACS1894203_2750 [Bacteroidia bacterium]GHT70508.1 hypothetical protein FACS189455_0320 [Bacteroidia bacterium]GHU87313.1 hypothetical protein FACS1894155_00090 [Bacteroidia bacterium]